MKLIKSKALRALCSRAARDTLCAEGFGGLRAAGTDFIFHRDKNGRFQGVHIQKGSNGREYTLNLAYHLPIVPACMTYQSKQVSDFSLLDFIFNQRLGLLAGEKREDRWWSLELTELNCERNLTSAFRESLPVFERTDTAWSDESRLIEWVSPEHISNVDLEFPVELLTRYRDE